MNRMTEQRRAILGALEKANRPLAPKELLARAGNISLTTVYRNLKNMVAAGSVAPVEVVGQPPRYEVAGLEHHHHFLCETCDQLYDVPGCPGSFERLAPEGFTVKGHELMLTGCCKGCA